MCTIKKEVCEKCGYDFKANEGNCPNCGAPVVTMEGVCVKDGMVNYIKYHPVEKPIFSDGAIMICKNCGGKEFKNVIVTVKRR